MTKVNVAPLFGTTFPTIFPFLLTFLVLLGILGLDEKFMSLFGVSYYSMKAMDKDENLEAMKDGKKIIYKSNFSVRKLLTKISLIFWLEIGRKKKVI